MAIYHFKGVIQTAKHKLPSPQTAPEERYFCSSESCEGKEPCRGDILFSHFIEQIYFKCHSYGALFNFSPAATKMSPRWGCKPGKLPVKICRNKTRNNTINITLGIVVLGGFIYWAYYFF
jgi:hypothetical protein